VENRPTPSSRWVTTVKRHCPHRHPAAAPAMAANWSRLLIDPARLARPGLNAEGAASLTRVGCAVRQR